MSRLPLVISTVALGLASGAFLRSPVQQRVASALDPAEQQDALAAKVELLDQQMKLLRATLAAPRLASPPEKVVGQAETQDSAFADLARRMGELEKLQEQVQNVRQAGMLPGPLSPAEFSAATRSALDRSAPIGERVEALRKLRPLQGRNDGRSPEVTAAMVDLIGAAATPDRLRADIIRQLEWIDHPHLKQPLVATLSNSKDPETRAESIETLQSFYGDPAVLALVTRLKDSDPDPRVRLEAQKRLDDWSSGRREP